MDDMSDQDADAEMEDDDNFAQMSTPILKPPPLQAMTPKQTSPLPVQRTRWASQRVAAGGAKGNFMVHGNRSASHAVHGTSGPMSVNHSVSNVTAAMQGINRSHGVPPADMGMAMQGGQGDPMYMD